MPESTTPVSEQETARLSGGGSGAGQLLQHRLDLIEDLWKSVPVSYTHLTLPTKA